MPDKTWLTDVATNKTVVVPVSTSSSKAEPQAPQVTLKLRGTSVSQMMVGETMLRLNRWPEFERVDLSYTQQGARDDLSTVEFEINAQLRGSTKGGVSPNGSH